MLNPSYSSLMKVLNEDADLDQKITSRYSVVIAAAKRARQIVAGAEYSDLGVNSDKAVSIAVNEIYHGHVRIVPKDSAETVWESAIVHNVPILIDDNFLLEETSDNFSDDFEGSDFDDDDTDIDDDSDDNWSDNELLDASSSDDDDDDDDTDLDDRDDDSDDE
jgi:DNA-directed RNA polymerase subunit omega